MSLPPVAERLTRLPDVEKRRGAIAIGRTSRKEDDGIAGRGEGSKDLHCRARVVGWPKAEIYVRRHWGRWRGEEAEAVMVGAATAREVEAAALRAVLLPQRRS